MCKDEKRKVKFFGRPCQGIPLSKDAVYNKVSVRCLLGEEDKEWMAMLEWGHERGRQTDRDSEETRGRSKKVCCAWQALKGCTCHVAYGMMT